MVLYVSLLQTVGISSLLRCIRRMVGPDGQQELIEKARNFIVYGLPELKDTPITASNVIKLYGDVIDRTYVDCTHLNVSLY